jgi:hypothetical protein
MKFNGSAKGLVSRGSTQVLSQNGLEGTADVGLLTPTDGDMVINSNAARSCGTGPCVYSSAGTGNGWKHLYSDATF